MISRYSLQVKRTGFADKLKKLDEESITTSRILVQQEGKENFHLQELTVKDTLADKTQNFSFASPV